MLIILLIVLKYIFMINLLLCMFLLRRIYLMKIFFLFYFIINERIKKNIKNIGINKYGLW